MKCLYCHESIDPTSESCPQCGLPIGIDRDARDTPAANDHLRRITAHPVAPRIALIAGIAALCGVVGWILAIQGRDTVDAASSVSPPYQVPPATYAVPAPAAGATESGTGAIASAGSGATAVAAPALAPAPAAPVAPPAPAAVPAAVAAPAPARPEAPATSARTSGDPVAPPAPQPPATTASSTPWSLLGPPKPGTSRDEEPPPSEKYLGKDPYADRPPRRVRPKPVPEFVVLPPSHALVANPHRVYQQPYVTAQPVSPTLGEVTVESTSR
ncbi:MAG TPA: hypothetical protein VK689_15155 [Armatimonadota bacterium]|nr:hypothetical protein [Armatimonadota bacterium]